MGEHEDERGAGPATDAPDGDGATAPHVAVQERLPLDEPVPFRLTTAGRRLVAPDDEPTLRVVAPRPTSVGPGGDPTDLDELDAGARARARAMRRGGMATLDIAERLDADPIHVEQWVADLPGPSRRRRRLTAVPGGGGADPEAAASAARAGVVAAWRAARDDGRLEAERRLSARPGLRGGLGVLAALLEPDQHALLLTGDDLEMLAAAWRWAVTTVDAADGPVRVLVRHDPTASADRAGREVADALGLPPAVVTTTRDPSRTGRPPAVRVRVADPVLAGRVAGWRRALLVDVSAPTDDAAGA